VNLLTLLRSLVSRPKPPPRALDLRGFWMTRDEAARWLDAIDPPSADDSHPTRGDIVKAARPEELLLWARANRDNTLRGRALCALYLAAWRGCRTSLDVEIQRIERAIAARGQRLDDMRLEARGACCPSCFHGLKYTRLAAKQARAETWLSILRRKRERA
jgi:hypothetical protein